MSTQQNGKRPEGAPSAHPFQISRRSFLKACSTAAAATGLPLWFVEQELAAAAEPAKALVGNDRPAIALIGCGGQGSSDAKDAQRFGDIVAVCDVDAKHVAAAVKKFTTKDGKAPDTYNDFRKLLERKDIHAIINGTPDHWHTLVNLACTKAKKDVYSEKPLTLTIDEGKHLVKAVHDSGIVLQTGTQQRSSVYFRMACEMIRNGRIGKLKKAIVWLPAGRREGPFQSSPVPPELNWDFWQGQAKAYDYIKERCHTTFRYWYDYSGGTMTDWGAHHNDIAYWAIGQIAPTRVEGKILAQPIPGGYTAISDYNVIYTYPDGIVLDIRVTHDDNGFGGVINKEGQRNGIRFEGETGWIWVNRDGYKASDMEIFKKPLPEDAVRLYKSNDHKGNFFECLRTRKAPICDVEIGHRSATICHLGAIALRTGLKLQWDPQKELFVGEGAKVANTYVAREMRKPYDYSFVA